MTSVLARNLILSKTYLTSISHCVVSNLRFRTKHALPILALKMNEAFVKYDNDSEDFHMSFYYVNRELNFSREFNFNRKASESVDAFIKRISTNMGKFFELKIRKKKMKGQPVPEFSTNGLEDKIYFVKNEEKVDGQTPCQQVFQDPTALKLVVLEEEFVIKRNFPQVEGIALPRCILAGFPVYPREFEATYVDKAKSTFTWYKSDDLKEWEQVGEGYFYEPTNSDIGYFLKVRCVPASETQTGVAVQARSLKSVQAGPGQCPFEIRHAFTSKKLSGKSFRIISYNILADAYVDTDPAKNTFFPHCPPHALAIHYRKLLVLKELIGFNSDIMCLQEVDRDVYEDDLEPSLALLDYDGTYNTKDLVNEGLATFFDKRRFEKIDFEYSYLNTSTGLNGFKEVWMKVKNNRKAVLRYMKRNTAVQVTTLRSKENPAEILVVGNTHLYFHPDADHIRLLQAYYTLVYIGDVVRRTKEKYPECRVSICLCGDFNSTPECGVFQLITQNYVSEDCKDWKSNREETVENVSLSHELRLSSACGTPEYTNFTPLFSGCLDYIFYERDSLKVEQVVPMPSKEELTLHSGLPSVVFPSDHISLCADLQWLTD